MGLKRFVKTDKLQVMIRELKEFHLVDARDGYVDKVIRGAKRIDFKGLAEGTGRVPYLTGQDRFNWAMKKVGIQNDDTPVVVYDDEKSRTAAKAWFTFKVFGKNNVAVLDGGLEKWLKENREICDYQEQSNPWEDSSSESEKPESSPPKFIKNSKLFKPCEYISAIIDLLNKSPPQTLTRLIDARNPLRFTGLSKEASGESSGSIPGSKNLPFRVLYNSDRTIKSRSELLETLKSHNLEIDPSNNLVHFSGFNLSACYNILALEEAGFENQFIFDGGWHEWISRPKPAEMPISVKQILEESYEKYLKTKTNK
jgi:thiosulfate/3-mercaptopyruvate sulfurtransferase